MTSAERLNIISRSLKWYDTAELNRANFQKLIIELVDEVFAKTNKQPTADDDEDHGYCPVCAGSGEGRFSGSTCSNCGGCGEI
jgi:hypothetical protein